MESGVIRNEEGSSSRMIGIHFRLVPTTYVHCLIVLPRCSPVLSRAPSVLSLAPSLLFAAPPCSLSAPSKAALLPFPTRNGNRKS